MRRLLSMHWMVGVTVGFSLVHRDPHSDVIRPVRGGSTNDLAASGRARRNSHNNVVLPSASSHEMSADTVDDDTIAIKNTSPIETANTTTPIHCLQNDETNHSNTSNSTNITVHSYTDASSFKTYKALNTSKQKFEAYLLYRLGRPVNTMITTTTVEHPEDKWGLLWEQGRLVTERTEWLSPKATHSFPDLLALYTERVWGFYHHEGPFLEQWLEAQYPDWRQLRADSMEHLGFLEQKTLLKDFLERFRSDLPYFYDRCEHCGASQREEGRDDEDQQTFVGYIHPNDAETAGKAMRTELYQCHVCHEFTRFPRFNSVRHVLKHKKGRCGEYSMLLFRILRFLGHDARWVVDWADHVWGEVYLHGAWVHLDPCEAAVDENLMYQDWGKRQVYIIGFWLPPVGEKTLWRHPLVEDVTHRYTTESQESIRSMREESGEVVQSAIQDATRALKNKLGFTNSVRNTTNVT